MQLRSVDWKNKENFRKKKKLGYNLAFGCFLVLKA